MTLHTEIARLFVTISTTHPAGIDVFSLKQYCRAGAMVVCEQNVYIEMQLNNTPNQWIIYMADI